MVPVVSVLFTLDSVWHLVSIWGIDMCVVPVVSLIMVTFVSLG